MKVQNGKFVHDYEHNAKEIERNGNRADDKRPEN